MILRLKFFILLILLLSITKAFSQSVNHWETIVKTGDNCKYYVPKSDIGTNWKARDFQDTVGLQQNLELALATAMTIQQFQKELIRYISDTLLQFMIFHKSNP